MAVLIARARANILRFGPTSALLLLSQAISAFSLFLLPLLGLQFSDVYSVGVQTGVGPYNGLVLGVVYLIVIGRPSFDYWKTVDASVIVFAGVLTAYSVVSALHRGGHHLLGSWLTGAIIVIFGIGGIALGLASVRGVRQACLGRPWLLAGITIAPNVGMGLATVMAHFLMPGLAISPLLPAITWAVVAWLVAVVMAVWPLPQLDRKMTREAPEAGRNKVLHIVGLIVGLITSTVLPIGFVTAAGELNAGSATVLFLANRIGAAVVGVLVNAVLMVSINWEDANRKRVKHSVFFPVASMILVVLAVGLHQLQGAAILAYGGVALAWLGLACSTPIILREANVRRMGLVIMLKGVADLAISSLALVYFQHAPSFTGYFGALMISQCVTTLVCGGALKQRRLVVISTLNLLLAIALLAKGW
ncbi:hypothetical protein [Novosphingobium sediminicola]|uniref:hypothetical protein n=1 Tax=Novosphingobium sediminicola TaxID=563162 RepID=UPI00161C143B|nr:hypothetical protein [Novosphingobium sediminicola]